MKIKFQYNKTSCRFLIYLTKNIKISVEVFGLNFIRAILKGQIKLYYENKRFQAHLKPGSNRKKTLLKWYKTLRVLNVLMVTINQKTITKHFYRKRLKQLGYLTK